MNYTLTAVAIIGIALFFTFILKPDQDAKNKIKQQRKNSDEGAKVTDYDPSEYPTLFYNRQEWEG